MRIALITMLLVAPMAIAAETHHCTAAKNATCCTKQCKSADGKGCAMNKDSKACNHNDGCTKSCCSAKK
jgi:hypothetical protein